VRLLLDENLSPALVPILSRVYGDTSHVRDLGLQSAPDPVVWAHAASGGYTIVTKDADFHHRSFLYGHPPKVIWIRLGNCSTRDIATLLVEQREKIEAFYLSPESSFLVLA
jgi:predicted nuclease of predicted toxin-antitoxin system